MKTVYIKRNTLFRPFNMMLCNNITKADESFFEDNYELFYIECEECEGRGYKDEDEKEECEECMTEGRHDTDPYQYFLANADQFDLERLDEYDVKHGYSEALDMVVIPIYDFGTSWSAFSYSKEVEDDYELRDDETLERQTHY